MEPTLSGSNEEAVPPAFQGTLAQVRRAQDRDIDGILALHEMVAAEGRWLATEAPIDRERLSAGLRAALQDGDSVIFVAVANDTVIGQLRLWPQPPCKYDLGMFVDASWRGKGVGSRLLETAVAWARSTGANKIVLGVFPDNDAAIALYTKAGFVREGYHPRHLRRSNGELRDLISMGLILRK
jgi:RimJ/RimL family protein N-acetyltransferase